LYNDETEIEGQEIKLRIPEILEIKLYGILGDAFKYAVASAIAAIHHPNPNHKGLVHKLGEGLSEIFSARLFYSIHRASVWHLIQIHLQYLILRIHPFRLKRDNNLFKFPKQGSLRGKECCLDELLA
jgi:hypothetical protein